MLVRRGHVSSERNVFMPDTHVLVTGASGLLGTELVRQLRTAKIPTTAMARRAPPADEVPTPWIAGDILDARSWFEPDWGVTDVVHCAALVGPGHRASEYLTTNATGTHRMLEAAQAAGVRHFVQVSTVGVYGYAAGRYDENTPAQPPRAEPYAWSKGRAEAMCEQFGADSKMSVSIVRPSVIYGPDEDSFLSVFADGIRDGKLRLIDGGQSRAPLVSVIDVADGIVRLLGTPAAHGGTYNLDGDGRATWSSVARHLAALMKVQPPDSVPRWLASAVATLAGWASLLPGMNPPLLNRAVVDIMSRTFVYDTARARDAFGFATPTPWDAGLESALHALRRI